MFIFQSNHPSANMLYHQYDETLWNTNSSTQWFQSHCVIEMLEVASDTILQTFGNCEEQLCWPSVSWLTSSWWLTAFVVGLEIFFFVYISFFYQSLASFSKFQDGDRSLEVSLWAGSLCVGFLCDWGTFLLMRTTCITQIQKIWRSRSLHPPKKVWTLQNRHYLYNHQFYHTCIVIKPQWCKADKMASAFPLTINHSAKGTTFLPLP